MAKSRDTLTQARLKELLHYNPDTGDFTWRVFRCNNAVEGSVAGSPNSQGYSLIHVDNISYKAHRLAWLYMTGEWPKVFIDHINGDRLDNAFANLREVNNRENTCNIKATRSDSKSGMLGAMRRGDKFVAEVRHNGERFFLGYFDTAQEAHEAYLRKKREVSDTFTL